MPELPNIDELAITASRQFESSRAQNDSLAVNEFVRDSGLLDQLPPEQHQSLLAIRLKVHADLKRKLGRALDADNWDQGEPSSAHAALTDTDTSVLATLNGEEIGPDSNGPIERRGSLPSREGNVVGTPAYMAPAQARVDSIEVGPCSDLFSFGVTLFEALTGESIHARCSGRQIIETVTAGTLDAIPQCLAKANLDDNVDHWRILQVQSQRGKSLSALRHQDEAIGVLKRAFFAQQECSDIDPAEYRKRLRSTESRLLKIHRAIGNGQAEDEWKEKCDQYREPRSASTENCCWGSKRVTIGRRSKISYSMAGNCDAR